MGAISASGVGVRIGACVLVAMLGLAGCVASDNYAPVAEVSGYEAVPTTGVYHVVQNDTLYSIAWRYGIDYRELAKINNIASPYAIHTGQVIYLNGEPPVVTKPKEVEPVTVAKAKTPVTPEKPNIEPNYSVKEWIWPTHGKILAVYSSKNKGIDIGGRLGSDVVAAAPGKVVYAGNGLRGYGNLIILKHNSQYLSAYAFNRQLFVKEGDWIKQGQKIATIGKDHLARAALHFEVRRDGKPVNPMNLLN